MAINDAAAIGNFTQGKWGSLEMEPVLAHVGNGNLHCRGQMQICTFFKQEMISF
jgi:hypothetical protein